MEALTLADLMGLKDKKYPGSQGTADNAKEGPGSKLLTEQTDEKDLPIPLLLDFKGSRKSHQGTPLPLV